MVAAPEPQVLMRQAHAKDGRVQHYSLIILLFRSICTIYRKDESKMNRERSGIKVGALGAAGNIILFIIKFIMGSMANSIAIIADSFNNLVDCTSSVITIAGFHISGKGRDEKHPFGHGRAEYLCGFIIALLILGAAFSLGQRSFKRLIDPEPLTVSSPMFLVPLCSVLIKSFLIYYTTRVNRILKSSALRATVRESCADMLITALTMITLLISPYTDVPVDGIAGLIITVFIMWSGLTALSENMDLLIGRSADKTLENDIRNFLLSYDVFEEVVSFAIHDYGPDEQIAVINVRIKQTSPSEISDDKVCIALRDARACLKSHYGLNPVIYWEP